MLDKNKRPIDLKISKSFIFSSNYQIKLYKLNSKFIITKKLRGYVLLSQAVSHQVPSALESLTSVFGMGTGVSSLLL